MSPTEFNLPKGINFNCTESVPITVLSKALCRVAAFLQDLDSSAELLRYEDWWEHDGLHFYKGPMNFHQLFALVESPRALLESMQGDDFVFVGVLAADASWYLRFYVAWDDEGKELFGRFDITLSESTAEKFGKLILEEGEISMMKEDALCYYKSCKR